MDLNIKYTRGVLVTKCAANNLHKQKPVHRVSKLIPSKCLCLKCFLYVNKNNLLPRLQ